MAGFKSFAESAEVEIDSGLTGIVGPNGCGKSNIVEGLRWVMGESLACQLRGGAMDDAIHGLLAIVPLRWEGTGRAGAVANAGDGEATVGQPENGTVSPRGICPVPARHPDDQG